jgi:hypothetical protein
VGRWLKSTDEGNGKLAELRAAGQGDGDLSRCIVDRLRPRLLLSELLTFSAEEWAAPDDGLEDWRAFECWKDARRAYSKQDPDSALGPVLDQMRV